MNRDDLIDTIKNEFGRQCSFGFGPKCVSYCGNSIEIRGIIDMAAIADQIIKLDVSGDTK